MNIKVSSGKVVCCINLLSSQTNYSIQANIMGPDQTSPRGAVTQQSDLGIHCLLSRRFKRTSR